MNMNKFILLLSSLLIGLSCYAQGQGWEQKSSAPEYSRTIPYSRVVKPYNIEVSGTKTVHIIFPNVIRYVDLGSQSIIAGKADAAENVLRVKSAWDRFDGETSLSVICDDGAYYSFNVTYNPHPSKMNIEMRDLISDEGEDLPTNRLDIFFREMGEEAPAVVKLLMRSIYENNQPEINNVATKNQDVYLGVSGIYAHNGLLYFHLYMRNKSNLPYEIDRIEYRLVDRTAGYSRSTIQEITLPPLRVYNYEPRVAPGQLSRSVYCLDQFTVPNSKVLQITVFEKSGNRVLNCNVSSNTMQRTKKVDNLKIRGKSR